jgi:hypothetical protein
MGTSHLAEVCVKKNISMYVIQQAAVMMGTGHGAAVCRKRNVSTSVELRQAAVARVTVHQAEEHIKRNTSLSVEIQRAAAMMGTGRGAAAYRKRNVSTSVELQQAAVTLMETVHIAEVCVKRNTKRDEARDHLIQHFSQGSGVRHIKLFVKQIVRHGRWMHSGYVQLKYVDRDHSLTTALCAGCLLTDGSIRGVGDGGSECDRSRVVCF